MEDSLIQGQDEFYVQWHLTNRCNLRCAHCYQEDYTGDSEMGLEELKSVADKLIQALEKWKREGRIALTGGEPLLKKELFPLIEYLEKSEHVSKVGILTNGIFVNPETVSNLQKMSKLHYVQISLEGSTAESHDTIRGEGSFEKTMKGIRLLVNNDIKVRVMFTLHRGNKAEVPAMIDLCIAEGIDAFTVERLVPTGSGGKLNDLLLTPEELRDVFQYVSDRSDEEYEKGTPITIIKYRTLWANVDPERAKADGEDTPFQLQLGAACSSGIDSTCIMPDATVYPCRRLPIPIGNLKEDSFFKIWYTSDVLWDIRDKHNLEGKCNNCEILPMCCGCRSMAYAVSGNYMAEDPQCWI